MKVGVRKVTEADVPEVAEALARAFADDPVIAYVIGERDAQRRRRRLFELDMHHLLLPFGECYTTEGPSVGAALWAPPGKWKQPWPSMLRAAPAFVRVMGRQLPSAMRLMSTVERKHPTAPPHYYLSTLGTEPDSQGKGVASALLQPVLERCDAEGVPAYLESSKEANVPFYARHGFEVTGTATIKDGPTLWLMWRESQARRPGEAER